MLRCKAHTVVVKAVLILEPEAWAQILTLFLSSTVTLGKSFDLPLPHCKLGLIPSWGAYRKHLVRASGEPTVQTSFWNKPVVLLLLQVR